MGTNIRLNYEMATAKAAIVLADAEALQTILNSLHDEVSQNVANDSVWGGEAAQKFLASWDEYAANFNSYVDCVKLIQEKIDMAATSVSNFDQQ